MVRTNSFLAHIKPDGVYNFHFNHYTICDAKVQEITIDNEGDVYALITVTLEPYENEKIYRKWRFDLAKVTSMEEKVRIY